MLTRRGFVAGLMLAGTNVDASLAQQEVPSGLLDEFLRQGQWSETADDNATPEVLSQDLLRRLVMEYKAHPNEPSGRAALGLFVLALGVAEWGVRDPSGLPPDPIPGKNWASGSSASTGKHLMSYSVGGVGLFHADGGELVEFVQRINQFPEITEQQKAQLSSVVDKNRYKDKNVTFDQLRAASVCRAGTAIRGKDLFGNDFEHYEVGGGANYCPKYFGSPNLTPMDWTIFKTWARIALRKKEIQQWLIAGWLENYWSRTLNQISPGDGFEEEAFINVRFRNSFSGIATKTTSPPGTPVAERIAKQMRAYRTAAGKPGKENRAERRADIIQRPIALYRAFAEKEQLTKFRF